ncbi:unnamed protein product [Clonostachys rosea]|uniref:F-box domain-containing protein n=1 Tax=Bionectria ochroleuca TaxID=29856 RepID=A0ABY6V042_BIOOC|nr:unnamed protein product [Clonostachys rosea]
MLLQSGHASGQGGGLSIMVHNSRPWCALCKISFEIGDFIVLVKEDGSLGEKTEFSDPPLDFEGHHTFGYSLQDTPDESMIASWKHTYHFGCCVEGFTPEVLKSTLDKIEYSYVPTVTEAKRRLDWLHRHMGGRLNLSLEKLPPEVTLLIAGFAPRELISAHAISTSEYDDPVSSLFFAGGDVWARVVQFEGREYIACLMNIPPEDEAGIVVKLEKPEGPVQFLYVAFDHLGIRKLVLVGDGNAPNKPPREGLWWASMSVYNGLFQYQSDGMKLRQIKPLDVDDFSLNRCWATPQPHNRPPAMYSMQTFANSTTTRIKSVEYNTPAVTGYSVRWTTRLSSFHAHVRGEEKFAFYDELAMDFCPSAIWIYMPMDEGELIEQFWVRSNGEGATPSALVMKTNHGRVWEAGPRPKPGEDSVWIILSQSTEAQRFFFNQSYFGISTLGFRDLPRQALALAPAVPLPKVTPDEPLVSEKFVYSSAPLSGLTSVRICLDREKRRELVKEERPNIVGLLFSYQDGRERSVGQVRLDWLQGPTDIGVSNGIMFKLSVDSRRIVGVQIREHSGSYWEDIPKDWDQIVSSE